jgi:DHA1 family bicyclomycin/chloramphenicol resistance-like MFS transporter
MLWALTAFTSFAALHLAVVAFYGETLIAFVVLQALTMASFGLISANLGAVAMEPLGHIAGTASSVQGMMTTVGGSLIGLAIGQSFNGTTLPFLIGFTLCGMTALAIALWTNRPEETMPGSLADLPD